MHATTLIAATRSSTSWLARAVVSGFMATIIMSIAFFIAYGFSYIIGIGRPETGVSSVVQGWMQALTSNQVLDLATGSVYVAAAIHVSLGVVWALVYASLFEPKLSGSSVRKGMVFSLLPWILSLVIFLRWWVGECWAWGLAPGRCRSSAI